MSKFVTIQELIDRLGYSHSSLANHIELHGVFGCDANKEIDYYDPDSSEIEDALQGIYSDFRFKADYEKFGCEWEEVADVDLYRFQGQGPNYFYGWSEDKVPDPWDVSDDPNWIGSAYYSNSNGIYIGDSRIYTIGRLLVTCKATAAEIATEIEKSGIYGFDQYDRLVLTEVSFDGHQALNVLAQWTKLIKKDPSVNSFVLNDVRFKNFGWPRGQLPSFSGVPKGYGLTEKNAPAKEGTEEFSSADAKNNIEPEPIEHLSSLSERQSYQAMIGGLLAYIYQTGKPISETKLLEWIDEKIKIRGVKRTNGKKLFKEGKLIIKEIRQLLAENDVALPEDTAPKHVKGGGK